MSPIYTRLFNGVKILAEPLIDFEQARTILANMLIASKNYGFFVQNYDEAQGKITFYATGKAACEGGTLERVGEAYLLTVGGEKATVKIGEAEIIFYAKSIEYPILYNVSFNWQPTVDKCGIVADAQAIVEPYYAIICDEKEVNFKQAIKDLQALQGFIWRTEMVVLKEKTAEGMKVQFVVPKGNFKVDVPCEVSERNEGVKVYTVTTSAKTLALEAETEKGLHKAILYL